MSLKNPLRQPRNVERAQTGVGAAYAVTFVLLVVSGVLALGYVYVSTPAISATDQTAEASTLGAWLVNDELSADSENAPTTSAQNLNKSAVDEFFNGEGSVDHRVIQNTDSEWIISLKPRETSGTNTIFDEEGDEELVVYSDSSDAPIGGVSNYQHPAILDGDVVIVEVKIW